MTLKHQAQSDLDKKFFYDQGSTDSKIAIGLNLTESAIKEWRKRNNLPPNKSNQGFKEPKDLSGKSPVHKINKEKSQTKKSKVSISPSNKIREFSEGNYIYFTPGLYDSKGDELYDDIDVKTSLDYSDCKTLEELAEKLEELPNNLRKIDIHISKIKSDNPDLSIDIDVDQD